MKTITLTIKRYNKTRHWAIYDGEELMTVALYLKGAREVCEKFRLYANVTVTIIDEGSRATRKSASHVMGTYHQLILPGVLPTTLPLPA